jgi:nucleotide-binding universal stress UspA family protein
MKAAVHCREQARWRRLQRIIVGHDLGSGGAAALESAVVLARRFAASIRLVHVVQARRFFQRGTRFSGRHRTLDESVMRSGADLEQVIDTRTDCRRPIDYEVRVGKPFFELVLAARAWRADLIVVGGPQRQHFHLWGSTAERLVRNGFAAVLVAHKPLNSVAKRFLIATDFSSTAGQAAEAGIGLARSFGGRIFFCHALDPTPWYSYPCDEETLGLRWIPELTRDDVADDWASFLGRLPVESVPWQVCTVEGRPVEMIVKYAEQIGADLIIIGTHGRTGLEYAFLGSVAEGVARRASTPVLTVGREGLQFSLLQIAGKKRFSQR